MLLSCSPGHFYPGKKLSFLLCSICTSTAHFSFPFWSLVFVRINSFFIPSHLVHVLLNAEALATSCSMLRLSQHRIISDDGEVSMTDLQLAHIFGVSTDPTIEEFHQNNPFQQIKCVPHPRIDAFESPILTPESMPPVLIVSTLQQREVLEMTVPCNQTTSSSSTLTSARRLRPSDSQSQYGSPLSSGRDNQNFMPRHSPSEFYRCLGPRRPGGGGQNSLDVSLDVISNATAGTENITEEGRSGSNDSNRSIQRAKVTISRSRDVHMRKVSRDVRKPVVVETENMGDEIQGFARDITDTFRQIITTVRHFGPNDLDVLKESVLNAQCMFSETVTAKLPITTCGLVEVTDTSDDSDRSRTRLVKKGNTSQNHRRLVHVKDDSNRPPLRPRHSPPSKDNMKNARRSNAGRHKKNDKEVNIDTNKKAIVHTLVV